jgi:acyl-CoA hydrolase
MTAGLVSLGATAATASAMTATEISVLLAVISFLGLALILGISNGYSMKFTAKADGVGEASMELNKND